MSNHVIGYGMNEVVETAVTMFYNYYYLLNKISQQKI